MSDVKLLGVYSADVDALQSELAALREELFQVVASWQGENNRICEERNNLLIRLTAAEQRNATLTGLLERWYVANCNDLVHVEDGGTEADQDMPDQLFCGTESGDPKFAQRKADVTCKRCLKILEQMSKPI